MFNPTNWPLKIAIILFLNSILHQNATNSVKATKRFNRFLSDLLGGAHPTSNVDKRKMELTQRINKLEKDLCYQKHLEMQKKCQMRIEIAVIKFKIKIEEKMEHYNAIVELINDLSAKEKPNYYEENEQLQKDTETVIKEIRRLDNQIMVYRRASSALNAACELHMDSNQLELYEPQYSNAFIQFIAEGAEYCSALKMGKSVDYPEQRQYNFFEELIEEIADTENAAKVVKKMQFSLNKTEQKKDYDAVLGPRGVLRHSGVLMREGKIGIEGRIEIGGEQKTTKKSLLKTQKLREQFYKVSNQKTKAAFEVRLVFSEPRKQQPLSEHKLLALHINAMASE